MTHTARWLLASVVTLAAVTSTGVAGTGPSDDDLDVLEAVFRFQHRQFLAGTGEANLVCLGLRVAGRIEDPPDLLMARFQDGPFRKASSCRASRRGVVELATLEPGVVFAAGRVRYQTDDDARVEAQYFRDGGRLATATYRVVRDVEGWVALGPILHLDPL